MSKNTKIMNQLYAHQNHILEHSRFGTTSEGQRCATDHQPSHSPPISSLLSSLLHRLVPPYSNLRSAFSGYRLKSGRWIVPCKSQYDESSCLGNDSLDFLHDYLKKLGVPSTSLTKVTISACRYQNSPFTEAICTFKVQSAAPPNVRFASFARDDV